MKSVRYVILISMVLLLSCALVWANPAPGDTFVVGANESQVVQMYGLERIAVANPDIADVVVVSGNELLIVGKMPGRTLIHAWLPGGRQTFTVEVGSNNPGIAAEIQRVLGLPDVNVSKIGGNIILEGKVNDRYQKERAEKFASAYGKVINLLELRQPIQVKLEALILEIRKSKEDNLGITWSGDGYLNGVPGLFYFGQTATQNPGGWGGILNRQNINGALKALITNNEAKILSRPNTITLSGDKASILAGGQIPVPVSSDNGTISVSWKDYGVKLEISPEVNSEGLITTRIMAESSALDWGNAVAVTGDITVPALTITKGESSIALSSGQTMAIGGLIKNEQSKVINKIPIIGDLPIIGRLFKSTDFIKGQTELLILVTPTIVDPATYMPAVTEDMKKLVETEPTKEKPIVAK